MWDVQHLGVASANVFKGAGRMQGMSTKEFLMENIMYTLALSSALLKCGPSAI